MPHEPNHNTRPKFNFVISCNCSRCHVRVHPLHDATVHDHLLRHVAVHLHHQHVHSTTGPFYRMFPLFTPSTGRSPCSHHSTRLHHQFTIIHGLFPLFTPFYRLFLLFTTTPQRLWLTTPLWTPTGGSLERGTREQRPCQFYPPGHVYASLIANWYIF